MTLGINILKCYGENILLKYKNFLGTALVLKKSRQNYEIIPQSLGFFFLFLGPH